ncbi:MAG: ATP-binding protein [Pirellulaceae bacterium]
MKSSRVFRKFVLVYLLLHLGAAVTFLIFASTWISSEMQRQSFRRLESTARLLRFHFQQSQLAIDSPEAKAQILELGKRFDIRLTLIAADGNVLADSDSPEADFENHGTRPEIVDAKRSGLGTASRVSSSIDEPLYYLAIGFSEPISAASFTEEVGFIRVSQNQNDLSRLRRGVVRYMWISGIVLAVLSAFFMSRFIQRETEPLQSFSQAARRIALGQYESVPSSLNRNDEWRTLSDAFRHMLSELSHREATLRANTSRIEAVLTSMIEGVLAIDATGVVILANDAACEMLNIDQTQLLNRKLLEVVRIPALQRAVEETQLRRMFSRVEFQTLTEPRRQIAARVSVMADGTHPGVAIVLHDVSELRLLESVRRDFVANVSHELKTPLASIKAYAETLKMGAIKHPEKGLQFVEQIETQADLLNQQVQDLLTLAKVESGQTIFNIQPVEIDAVCQSCVDSFQDVATSKSIDLKYEPLAAHVKARVDRSELQTILNNLISNAVRYTPNQGTVTVTSYQESRTAVIEVTDTGIGIASDHQPRIFERFYRVDSARSRELGGTGLGLSIVKHLTQSMGGSVHLTSSPGKGSKFKVKFPLASE